MITVNITTKKQVAPMEHPFRKDNCHAFAMLNEDECIFVTHAKLLSPAVQVGHSGLPFTKNDTVDCTREEFFELYENTISRIGDVVGLVAESELQPA